MKISFRGQVWSDLKPAVYRSFSTTLPEDLQICFPTLYKSEGKLFKAVFTNVAVVMYHKTMRSPINTGKLNKAWDKLSENY